MDLPSAHFNLNITVSTPPVHNRKYLRVRLQVDTYALSASDLVHAVRGVQFTHRPLAHNLSTNPKDELPR